ncbi:hypothetical protein CRM22_002113 [Opisthorchis felineus]|uniref:Phosphodiesterase n=1 Tax=Opisthorchis felineus TaxID=147828 RepID=A0A4S2M7W3_OPIFE|nr:hypothetical protein CRM22_002113 [Opisthorchis felineus]
MGISSSCCRKSEGTKRTRTQKKMNQLNEDKLCAFLKRHPHIVERYVVENCTQMTLNQWSNQLAKRRAEQDVSTDAPTSREEKRTSRHAASNSHQSQSSALMSWKLIKATRAGQSNKLLIFATLISSLCENIPVDGSTLYLKDAEGKFIYVHDLDQPIQDPAEGVPKYEINSRKLLACYAVETGKCVFSDELPKDVTIERCSRTIQSEAKYVIAHPIMLSEDETIGVIEIYRAASRRPFSDSEKQLTKSIVRWAQLVLASDEKLMASEKAQALGDFILEVIRNLFTKVKNMDNVIKVIMEHAKVLVRAERVTLFLVDHKKNELYSSILDIGDVDSAVFVQDETNEIRLPLSQGIVGYVARTGQPIRIADAYKDPRFYAKVDEGTQRITRSVLAVPLADGKQVVGVIEMLNKHQGVFTEDDEEFLVAYSIYCTLAINVARMYDRIYRSDKKYRVALEVLTYHNCVTEADVAAVLPFNIPENIPGITQYDFSPWDIPEEQEIPTVAYMVYDLAGRLIIDKMTLIRFMLTVRKNYRPISYHNWDHAFSVAHSMYFLLKVSEHRFVPIERVCLFVAAICHDLDHRGYDNRFMKKYSSPLASLYSSSPMEHHHFNMTITILQQRDHNIFRYFRNASYRNPGSVSVNRWKDDYKPEYTSFNFRMTVVSIAMPTCDLCAMFKPWDVQVKVVMLIMQEFWNQGDREKASANKPLSLMDRDEAVQLADGQVGFIRAICLPCYSTIVRVFPQVSAIVDAAQSNLKQWEAISKLSYEERERILQQQMKQKFAKIVRRTAMNISSHARK